MPGTIDHSSPSRRFLDSSSNIYGMLSVTEEETTREGISVKNWLVSGLLHHSTPLQALVADHFSSQFSKSVISQHA